MMTRILTRRLEDGTLLILEITPVIRDAVHKRLAVLTCACLDEQSTPGSDYSAIIEGKYEHVYWAHSRDEGIFRDLAGMAGYEID